MNRKIEICVDSVESCINAERGGADRLELCGNMFEGGTTPSYGVLQLAREMVSKPIYAMVRPRGGDFCYNDIEFEIMKREIKLMKELKIDGIVFGILTKEGKVDKERCSKLLDLWGTNKATFHRAIDVSSNLNEACEDIISLGFERILTSGGEANVMSGIIKLKELVEKYNDKIIIMPGSGINERNIEYINDTVKANEYHMTANKTVESVMQYRNENVFMGASLRPPEFSVKYTDENKVKNIKSKI
ncbi:copper homeostasis protein CutC [Brachyspira pilosicoli]|uniref:PF03932 family protein CutC n=1 Tax=Brachyspira pilosicoli TaxID=52584 RepID=A0AAJ6G8E0_BRAPL|nr:copper homeostasis protein CutC [Brachyspira pilosicoli]WIH90547.1 copper homeostasis protein CutC [Brachyspira pilosicoli]WIH92838.1 copper homeostasis protein CutC [Brachyspira pilosicoli]WIH95127.1 copper homeostasis protein CutC [Brachyspira pilosicoli]